MTFRDSYESPVHNLYEFVCDLVCTDSVTFCFDYGQWLASFLTTIHTAVCLFLNIMPVISCSIDSGTALSFISSSFLTVHFSLPMLLRNIRWSWLKCSYMLQLFLHAAPGCIIWSIQWKTDTGTAIFHLFSKRQGTVHKHRCTANSWEKVRWSWLPWNKHFNFTVQALVHWLVLCARGCVVPMHRVFQFQPTLLLQNKMRIFCCSHGLANFSRYISVTLATGCSLKA